MFKEHYEPDDYDEELIDCDSLGIREFSGIVKSDDYYDICKLKEEISNLRECISLLYELHVNPCDGDFNSDICPGCLDFNECSTYNRIKEIIHE